MDKVISRLSDMQSIIERGQKFNVPRYQRLYVWEDEQVKTLFNDIYIAAQSGRKTYYIGGIITVPGKGSDGRYDLVDGQQRFTTLWLLANELGGEASAFAYCNGALRISFSIRHSVEAFFNNIAIDSGTNEFDDLVRIGNARRTLSALISEHLKSKEATDRFTRFLLEGVKMVITQVPSETDLNKLFETLNNRGIQLAQHEILKAQLLSKITNTRKRYRYGLLWNACSDMDNYIERSLTYETGQAREIAKSHQRGRHDWNYVTSILAGESNKQDKLTLQEILNKRKGKGAEDLESVRDYGEILDHATDDELEPVRSILTFPQLLLHTLRIYLHKRGESDIERINEKELLATFSAANLGNDHVISKEKIARDEKGILDFLDLLFVVREIFDRYIIKWVRESDDTETHLIKTVYKQNQKPGGHSYYLRRIKTTDLDGLALLQSMLYHSQQNTTQYWLTPFLYRMLEFPDWGEAYGMLKKLDNLLFSSLQEHIGLTERTWESMDDWPEVEPTTLILSEVKGTGFPHYWFYKTEFVLWHERNGLGRSKEWSAYRMTARNSVEHVSPQNPRDPLDKVCKKQLDHFGNLALVTRSINSEYSDLPYRVKKAKFDDKKAKGSLDSLKSDMIYSYDTWNDALALNHQDKVIAVIEQYFNDNT